MNIQLNEDEPIYIKLPSNKTPCKQVSLFDCIKDNKLLFGYFNGFWWFFLF
jgi:hypothetical protein